MNKKFATDFSRKKTHYAMAMTAVLLGTVLSVGTVVGFAAEKADKKTPLVENVNLTVTDCNVIVKTLSSNTVGKSSTKDGFRYELADGALEMVATKSDTTMNIELKATKKQKKSATDMSIIYIPEQQYKKITVTSNGAGISLPPLNAAINITNNSGAMNMSIPKDFDKTLDFKSTGGANTLVLSTLADNYTLNITGKGSAINVPPELPKYNRQANYQYVKGSGKAILNLNMEESAFSLNMEDMKAGKPDTFTVNDEVYSFIENEEQLRLIGTAEYPMSGNYMLKNDITLKKPWVPIGHSDTAPFTGRFNGNGFTIKNVTIDDQEGKYKYLGFFGWVNGGELHNITLENVSIKTGRKSDVCIAPKGTVVAVLQAGIMSNCSAK